MNNNNSRRSFLSSLAILSAGTVLAGNPSNLFSADGEQQFDLKKTWNAFIKAAGASVFLNIGMDLPVNHTNVKGHRTQKGTIFNFEKENLLAQPTWIYWANNEAKPADVIINIYENSFPYNRIIALDRFQLNALFELTKKSSEKNLLLAVCCKNDEKNSKQKLKIKTSIKKRKQTQNICFYKNNKLILKENLFYNV